MFRKSKLLHIIILSIVVSILTSYNNEISSFIFLKFNKEVIPTYSINEIPEYSGNLYVVLNIN